MFTDGCQRKVSLFFMAIRLISQYSSVLCPALLQLSLLQKCNWVWVVRRYADLTACLDSITLEELIMAVRRQSQGFSRGTSAFRGVTRHPSGAPQRTLESTSNWL